MNITDTIRRFTLLFLLFGLNSILLGQSKSIDTIRFDKHRIKLKISAKRNLDALAQRISNDSLSDYGVFAYGKGKNLERGILTIEYLVSKKKIERYRLVLFTEHPKNIKRKSGNYVVIRRFYSDEREGCKPPPLPELKKE